MSSSISTELDVVRRPRVLVVEDDRTSRRVLTRFLTRHGYDVVEAESGEAALERFEESTPDVSIIDIGLPGIDGFEVVRRIRGIAADAYTPIIMLTASQDDESVEAAIGVGADDYVAKPFRPVLLLHRVASCVRTGRLFEAVDSKRETLEQMQAFSKAEQEHAESVLSRIVASSANDDPRVRTYQRAMNSECSGDMFLAERTPSGAIRFMLADSTGHGLTAAICTLPLISLFQSLARGGVSLRGSISSINAELSRILPTGHFVAAIIAEYDAWRGELMLWNAGMPDAVVRQRDGGPLLRMPSNGAPLAVSARLVRKRDLHVHTITEGASLYMFSDGMSEANDASGEQFTEERLFAEIDAPSVGDDAFEAVISAQTTFVGETPPTDDASFVELRLDREERPPDEARVRRLLRRLTLNYVDEGLVDAYPGRQVSQEIAQWPNVAEHAPTVGMVISELFVNSLDHGLLGLDSSMRSPAKFAQFVDVRERAVATVRGFVNVEVTLYDLAGEDVLEVVIRDSGPGWKAPKDEATSPQQAHGRGLQLIRKLCDSVRLEHGGKRVVATIRCPRPLAASA